MSIRIYTHLNQQRASLKTFTFIRDLWIAQWAAICIHKSTGGRRSSFHICGSSSTISSMPLSTKYFLFSSYSHPRLAAYTSPFTIPFSPPEKPYATAIPYSYGMGSAVRGCTSGLRSVHHVEDKEGNVIGHDGARYAPRCTLVISRSQVSTHTFSLASLYVGECDQSSGYLIFRSTPTGRVCSALLWTQITSRPNHLDSLFLLLTMRWAHCEPTTGRQMATLNQVPVCQYWLALPRSQVQCTLDGEWAKKEYINENNWK